LRFLNTKVRAAGKEIVNKEAEEIIIAESKKLLQVIISNATTDKPDYYIWAMTTCQFCFFLSVKGSAPSSIVVAYRPSIGRSNVIGPEASKGQLLSVS